MIDQSSLFYTAEHEWVRIDSPASEGTPGMATVGITAYAATKLGDVVYIELPAEGTRLAAGKIVGEIESTKSVGELFAPVDGDVIAANAAVVNSPELVNSDPFGEGWLITVSFTTLPTFLTFAEYNTLVGE